MALFSPFALGAAGDVWKMNQQDLLNRQRQQQINDMLANDALKRQMIQSQVTGGGMGYLAMGGQHTMQPPAPQGAPAPAPGQNSAQNPLPAGVTARSFGVPQQGAGIQSVPLPGAAPTPTFVPGGGFAGVTTPDQVRRAVGLDQMSPGAGASVVASMMRHGHVPMSPSPQNASAQVPTSQAPPVQATPVADRGTVGRALALAANNQPIGLVAQQVKNLKAMYPNITPQQAYFAMQSTNPTLMAQAKTSAQLAGMTIDSLFKGLTSWAQITNAQTRQAALPSQIQANEARAQEARSMGQYYSSAVGGGSPAAGSSPPPSFDLALSYLNGTLGSTSGPVGIGRQMRAFQQLQAIGLTPAAEKPYQNDLTSSRTAVAQLQQRVSTLQATSQALDTQLAQANQDAQRLHLSGPVAWNKGKLSVGGQVIPTNSPLYQLFQHYDALVAEASREAGAQQMFGKATVAGLKNGAQIVTASKGEGLQGVLQGLRDGAQASIAALNHTITGVQLLPQLRLISQSSKPAAAAQAFGFTPMTMTQLKAYAKQYKISDDQAAMALATNPNQRYYVVGYPYGQ
ncbi:MAG: hypothetical protein B7Z66_15605 [Chromatiales bacterium 21-64-14]|nr:MAG: hypothetical protein B7Z66_15605 [Chromatiales bacterium 21-64-14]